MQRNDTKVTLEMGSYKLIDDFGYAMNLGASSAFLLSHNWKPSKKQEEFSALGFAERREKKTDATSKLGFPWVNKL